MYAGCYTKAMSDPENAGTGKVIHIHEARPDRTAEIRADLIRAIRDSLVKDRFRTELWRMLEHTTNENHLRRYFLETCAELAEKWSDLVAIYYQLTREPGDPDYHPNYKPNPGAVRAKAVSHARGTTSSDLVYTPVAAAQVVDIGRHTIRIVEAVEQKIIALSAESRADLEASFLLAKKTLGKLEELHEQGMIYENHGVASSIWLALQTAARAMQEIRQQ